MGMYHIRQSFSFNYCTDFNKECAQKFKTLLYYSCHLLLCFQKLDFSQSFRHEMHSVQTSNARTLLKATIDSFIIYNGFTIYLAKLSCRHMMYLQPSSVGSSTLRTPSLRFPNYALETLLTFQLSSKIR